MKQRRPLYLVAILALITSLLIWVRPHSPEETATGVGAKPTWWQSLLRTKSSSTAADNTPSSSPNDSSQAAQEVSPEFSEKFSTEASKMEQFSGDPATRENALRTWAQALTLPEVQFLKIQALSQQSSANERILATFLLTLTSDNGPGQQALLEFVTAPLQVPTDFAVHSPQETLSAQEKALRRMAIDALIEKARRQGNTDELQSSIDKIQDPALRDYAQKALKKGS